MAAAHKPPEAWQASGLGTLSCIYSQSGWRVLCIHMFLRNKLAEIKLSIMCHSG